MNRFLPGLKHQSSPFIDAHQHFWGKELLMSSHLPPKMAVLVNDFYPGQLKPLLDQAGVDKTVLVQTYSSIDNTIEFLSYADTNDWIGAVVGWVNLADPEVGKSLDRFSLHPKFKGVRHQWEDETDPTWILRSEIIRGLQEVSRRALSFDVLAKPHNWRYIADLAEQLPDLNMVIDHIAKPSIARKQFEEWRKVMARAAQYPKMMCKLSGMVTEADWDHWTANDLKPYIDTVIEVFGPDRVMFGSDWPVCLTAGSYSQVLDAFLEAIAGYTEEVKLKVLGCNAMQFYRIP